MKKKAILEKEEALRLAMLTSDVQGLSKLLADSLMFTLPTGDVANKEMDLSAHESGLQKLSKLECIEQNVKEFRGFVVVAAKMKLEGKFGDHEINGTYCYTRVWSMEDEEIKVVAGQAAKVDQ